MPPTTQVNIHQLQDTLDTYFTIPTSLTIETHFLQTTEHQSNQNNLQKQIKYRHVMCTVMFSLWSTTGFKCMYPLGPHLGQNLLRSHSCIEACFVTIPDTWSHIWVLEELQLLVQPFKINVYVKASDGGTVNKGGSLIWLTGAAISL